MPRQHRLPVGARDQRGDLRRQEPRELRALPVDRGQQLALVVAQSFLGERRLDAGLEDLRIDGLRQVVGGAHPDAADDAVELVDARDHDDRHVAQRIVGLERGQRLVPVHLGHHDVEQDEVDRFRARVAQRARALRPSSASTATWPMPSSRRTSSRRLNGCRRRPGCALGSCSQPDRRRGCVATSARLEGIRRDRLGDVVVHPGLEARLTIAVHRVRGHRHDPWTVGGHRRRIRRVASSPSSSGIWMSISTTSYAAPSSAAIASRPLPATSAR